MAFPALLQPLVARLLAAASGLDALSTREVPGGLGLFAGDVLFALVMTDARIAVRLPDATIFAAMLKTPGMEPWHPKGAAARDWLLLPASELERPAELATIVGCAHGLATGHGPPTRQTHTRRKGHTTSSETPTSKRRTRTRMASTGAKRTP